ncbi:MAG TPA: hypothetical protein VK272_04500, partial [Solirubrobacteraceae bacterium]|nr:hypothetical protein [Solirubrobacteraceae bacterium]
MLRKRTATNSDARWVCTVLTCHRALGRGKTYAPLIAVLLTLAGASSASANTAWWHLTSGLRPSSIHAGAARSEVQEIRVFATEGEVVVIEPISLKEYLAGERQEFKSAQFPYDASHEVAQAALEGLYGAGNVTISGGPGDPLGANPYVVTFTGALVDQPLDLMVTEFSSELGGLRLGELRGEATTTQSSAGRPDGEIMVSAVNLGDADAEGASEPITLVDSLPAGVRAAFATGVALGRGEPQESGTCSLTSPKSVKCEFAGRVRPYYGVEAQIGVVVEREPETGQSEVNQASVSGGGAPPAATSRPLSFGSEPVFGVEDYELSAEEEGGAPDRQAGSHPFQLTSTLKLNQTAAEFTPALVKDLSFRLPPGLVGNPTPIPKCTLAQFHSLNRSGVETVTRCPLSSAVGVATVMINKVWPTRPKNLYRLVVPVFNIEPAEGEPARFGFYVPEGNVPVLLDTSVRSGEDYGVTVSTSNISQAVPFLLSEVAFWGVPGDPRHNGARGYLCLAEPENPTCTSQGELHPPPLLALPTSCAGPLQSSVLADSWAQPDNPESVSSPPLPALGGCNRLPFSPSIRVAADGQATSTPTGLNVDVHVPQEESLNAAGLSESDPKDITVVLPEGVDLNPAAADGLEACSETQIGFTGLRELNPTFEPGVQTPQFTATTPSCPLASKIANATIFTPLLANPLKGAVYLAAPQNFAGFPQENPFSSLLAMYLVTRDPVSGVLVKLAGSVSLNEATGQITATFDNSPQAPFEDAKLEFFGGERAPLATPAHCGSFTSQASFSPWSGNPPVSSSASFEVTSGPNGAPCPSTLPFAPSLTSGSTVTAAGAFSPLTTTISREDGNQNIQSVTLHYPPGLSGMLKGVPLCPEAQANAGTCGEGSL